MTSQSRVFGCVCIEGSALPSFSVHTWRNPTGSLVFTLFWRPKMPSNRKLSIGHPLSSQKAPISCRPDLPDRPHVFQKQKGLTNDKRADRQTQYTLRRKGTLLHYANTRLPCRTGVFLIQCYFNIKSTYWRHSGAIAPWRLSTLLISDNTSYASPWPLW